MGGTCGPYGEEKQTQVSVRKPEVQKQCGRSRRRVDTAQNTDKRRAVVITVKNISLHKMQGISCLAQELLASQGLHSMELVTQRRIMHLVTAKDVKQKCHGLV